MKITGYRTAVTQVSYDESLPGVHIILRLHTDEGLEGIAYITRIHEAGPAMLSLLDLYVNRILGMDPLDSEAVGARLFRRRRAAGVRCARSQRDRCGAVGYQRQGRRPARYKLMGGFRNRVPCYAELARRAAGRSGAVGAERGQARGERIPGR